MGNPKEIRRRVIGVQVLASHNTFPRARAIYDVMYSDGTTKAILSDQPIWTVRTEDMEHGDKHCRPDLFATMHAAYILIADILKACKEADGFKEDWER
jgi:metal-dependent HD superfamily phosphatase/phosphodiesterase